MKSDAFQAITTDPLNGAPTPETLTRSAVTPVEHFFVRNHAGPANGLLSAVIRVGGLVSRGGLLSLDDMPRTTVQATLQCAGNRRCGMIAHRPIPNEVPWTNEAIGNAIWEGVSLAAVLGRAGVTERDTHNLHVWFLGGDVITGKGEGAGFGASIPFQKAISPQVILADTMNGAPLTAEHGAPLRVIVPGYIGARSVKWLTDIRVEREPSPNHFQAAYSLVDESGARGEVLGPLRVNSAFALADEAECNAGPMKLTGWSMAGGDATIIRVEVSVDGGRNWMNAAFTTPETRYVWRLWEVDVTLPRGTHELVCRACDSSGATQPSDPRDVWNAKGYMNNCWHRVQLRVN